MKTIDLSPNEQKEIIIFQEKDACYNITLKKDAYLKLIVINLSDSTSELSVDIYLEDEGASADILSLVASLNANIISNLYIHHLVKNTKSHLNSYAIAKGNSLITLNNNAKIEKDAIGAEVVQKAKGLCLDDISKIKAQPNLYIDCFDVIASHAASVGSLNQDELFYLMSRGLSYEEASSIIVEGFAAPIIDAINNEEIKKEIKKQFDKII